MDKLIIEARINEYAMRDVNAKVPWTAAEIADAAAVCRAAGAAIVHFHAREEDGAPSHDADITGDCIARIRAASDILVHPTLGFVTLDAPPQERIGHVVALAKDSARRPDFAPMDMGSTNVDRYDAVNSRFRTTDLIYKNSTATLRHIAHQIAGAGGHIAIGLGDHPYDEVGCPSNAELSAKVAARALALGREVATPDETREMMAMG